MDRILSGGNSIADEEASLITLKEICVFSGVNIFAVLFGIFLWNIIWIKEYGANIPNVQYGTEEITTFFHTKNLKIFLKEFLKKFRAFEKKYLIRSIGTEAYIYLRFQKTILSLIMSMSIISLVLSFISTIAKQEKSFTRFIHDVLLDNKQMDNFNSFLHMLGVVIYTFLHFRFFSQMRREATNIYFERFDLLSRQKDYNWLSSRTLHISGLAPNERNTSILKHKLDLFLSTQGGGRVVEIQFIPNYQKLLELERKRNQLFDLKSLINKKENSFVRKYMFPKIFRKDQRILKEIEDIENKIQKETENPVVSSGHAFVCFDSLLSANKCLYMYQEGFCKKLKLKIELIWEAIKHPRRAYYGHSRSFQRFRDEEIVIESLQEIQPENIKILVDQMIEPYDIIWTNVGGDRGIYICRRIFIIILVILMLVFLTTPTFDYLNFFEFNWLIDIPYGYIIKTYLPPLMILLLNLILIYLIDASAIWSLKIRYKLLIVISLTFKLAVFEKHYTHSRFQFSVFTKSFFYMLLNILIVPGITLSTANSVFDLIKGQINNIPELLSKLLITNSGYFFVTLIIQNGTISPMFYVLRLHEIFNNSLSPFIVFYKRHFANSGKQWHRKEGYIFQFGYFYAQMLTFYTICIVFSSTVPFILLAGLYFFYLRHLSDFYSLLCIHRMEIDSSGYLINQILNISNVPVLFYQIIILSLFLIKQRYNDALIILGIFIISLIFAIYTSAKYILDIYALHDALKVYDQINPGEEISGNELNKWRNKFKHPLVLPVHLDDDTMLISPNQLAQITDDNRRVSNNLNSNLMITLNMNNLSVTDNSRFVENMIQANIHNVNTTDELSFTKKFIR